MEIKKISNVSDVINRLMSIFSDSFINSNMELITSKNNAYFRVNM